MGRNTTILGYFSLLMLAICVFNVKYTVLGYERQLRKAAQDIYQCSEEIHLLQGEWAVLTQPSRLENLSERYLKLTPTKAAALYPVNFQDHQPSSITPDSAVPDKMGPTPFGQRFTTWVWGGWSQLTAKGSAP